MRKKIFFWTVDILIFLVNMLFSMICYFELAIYSGHAREALLGVLFLSLFVPLCVFLISIMIHFLYNICIREVKKIHLYEYLTFFLVNIIELCFMLALLLLQPIEQMGMFVLFAVIFLIIKVCIMKVYYNFILKKK
jgi:hypothetical protein